jgi:hypothetical protein
MLLMLLLCFDQLDVCTLDTTQLSSCTCICFPVTTTQLLIAGVQPDSAYPSAPLLPRLPPSSSSFFPSCTFRFLTVGLYFLQLASEQQVFHLL